MSHIPLSRVCIYGAGAIGGWIGTRLAATGCEVSVVARGDTLQAIQQHGLRLHTTEGNTCAMVQASEHPASLGIQDVVVLAVKAPALPEIARQIAPLIGPHTIVLTAMNGVPWWFLQGFGGTYQDQPLHAADPGGAMRRAIPTAHIIGCVVHASCSSPSPGSVHHHMGHRLILGEPSGATSARIQQLSSLLTSAGFDAPISDCIQRDIWYKLWGNMTVNPISAITGATTDRIMDDALVRGFASHVMSEAQEIGQRLGFTIDQQPEDRHAVTRQLGAFKTSMLQDAEAGKAIELDALVTVVRELGALVHVTTPWTDALLGLARLYAQMHGLYPWPTPSPHLSGAA